MKRSDKIRLALVIVIGCLLILTAFWFKFGKSQEDSRDGDIELVQQEIASQAGSGLSETANAQEEDVTAASGASSSAVSTGDAASQTAASEASTSQVKPVDTSMDISGNSLYRSEEIIADGEPGKYTSETAEHTLQELRGFWESVGEDALKDLWLLERYQKMFVQLDKTDDREFFYSGDKNDQGLPEGRGIAVYGGYRLYLGEWKNGRREGAGDWYQFYPEDSGSVVSVHAYTGGWKDDLPCGEGNDRYEYYTEKMDDVSHYPLNVIGNFTDGLYDGEMYVVLKRSEEIVENWYGTCVRGVWQPVSGGGDLKGKIPALYREDDPETVITILTRLNSGYGVENVK